ncbi:hypothetical protein [Halothermothrix orenii]|uniref:Uncharacterized protein n=1 Tax=Halothermothrix orenii (strain H 168 / OCM 544 / DSM 9562) TaxID=373903 RepID=B8D1N9_HALOH|nr:hypothetical protein [Halothermothrix orenii]ACL69116.1 hypothetical protein Hore_03550 [Halothermothrix orenii H 168]
MVDDFFNYVKDELHYYYRPTELAAIKKRIHILIDEVYFNDPDNDIIFDFTKSKDELYQLNREKAEELARLFDRSPARLILKGKDREIIRENLKRECLLDGIVIIQSLKEIIRGED